MGTHCSSELHGGQIKSSINMQAFLLTTLAAVAMAQPDTGYGYHPRPYGHPAPHHPYGRYRRSADSEPAPAPEAKPLVPLYGLKHNLVYPALPNDPTAPAAWTAAHPAGLAHESVAGGLRTNHGDGTSYVFQSNIV